MVHLFDRAQIVNNTSELARKKYYFNDETDVKGNSLLLKLETLTNPSEIPDSPLPSPYTQTNFHSF
jgi:hypothetical protein